MGVAPTRAHARRGGGEVGKPWGRGWGAALWRRRRTWPTRPAPWAASRAASPPAPACSLGCLWWAASQKLRRRKLESTSDSAGATPSAAPAIGSEVRGLTAQPA